MEAIIVAYQNITARQYVQNVGRLHWRWKRETKPRRRTLVVLHKSITTGGKVTGLKLIIMIIDKTHKCKENGRHAVVLEVPERVYEECQVQLEKAIVKSHETIMLTLVIGGCL